MQLTNLQIELLKAFSYQLSETQLKEIKNLLADYFAGKVTLEMDNFWEENEWSEETIENLAQQHLKTEYK